MARNINRRTLHPNKQGPTKNNIKMSICYRDIISFICKAHESLNIGHVREIPCTTVRSLSCVLSDKWCSKPWCNLSCQLALYVTGSSSVKDQSENRLSFTIGCIYLYPCIPFSKKTPSAQSRLMTMPPNQSRDIHWPRWFQYGSQNEDITLESYSRFRDAVFFNYPVLRGQ